MAKTLALALAQACRLLLLTLVLGLLPARAVLAQMVDPAGAAPLPLDEGVRTWLAAHRAWRVGVVPDWPPVDRLDAQGRHTGLSADVLHEVAKRLGVQVTVVGFADYREALDAARDGRLELLASVTRSPGREQVLRFTRPYARLPVAYLGRQGRLDFSESPDLGGRVVAVEQGYVAEDLLKARFPAARLLPVHTTLEALRAVSEGRADLYRGALLPAHYLIERELITNLAVVNRDPVEPSELSFASRHAQAAAAVDAALAALGEQGLRALTHRWQPLYAQLTPHREGVVPSAEAVRRLGEVRVAYDAGFSPLTRQERDGSAGGLGVQMLRRSAEAVGLRYRLVAQPSFAQAVRALQAGEADVVVAAVRTPEREAYARFVGPYYQSPSVIVSRIGQTWTTLAGLSGQRLAIDGRHYLIEHIQRTAPGVRLVEVANVGDVLKAVAAGEVDAGLTNVEYAATVVPERYAGKLQVTGIIEDALSELSFMVRRDREDIALALAAGLDAVPTAERRAIANAELRTKVLLGTRWGDVLVAVAPVVGLLFGLLLASLFHARRLRAARELLRSQRDDAKSLAQAKADFLAEFGHDVRTPLVALSGGLRMLQDKLAAGQDAQPLAARLAASSDGIVGLLNQMLDASRLEAGRMALRREPGDMAAVVRRAAEQFRPSCEARGLRLVVTVPADLPPLLLDEQRATQVVNNLLGNAVKFTEHGEVSLDLDARRLPSGLWALTLTVADTGIGMDAATQQRLFERFSQGPTAQQQAGHGLGMSIVAELVRLAQGRVQVHSEPGRGTRIVLSVLAEPAPAAAPAPAAVPVPVRPWRVFLVDDDETSRLVLAEGLRRRGAEVVACDDLSRIERQFAASGCTFFVTDAHLGPGEPGPALAARVKAARGDEVVTVVLSGDEAPASLPAGVDRWLAKPSSPGDEGWLDTLQALAGQPLQAAVDGEGRPPQTSAGQSISPSI